MSLLETLQTELSSLLSSLSSLPPQTQSTLLLPLLPLLYLLLRPRPPPRSKLIPLKTERILVLGASSGIGRAIAGRYAARGGRVCVVGRREGLVGEVVEECLGLVGGQVGEGGKRILGVAADFADVDEMVRLRETIEREWNGLDTLIVAAGVSALRPLMDIAGVQATSAGQFSPPQATRDGIQNAVDVATAALRGNYIGPLVAAVTFIPLLQSSSPAPSILLLNSLASLIPPPTRTLYASTKSASLTLYQALSTEHPRITFSLIIPSTVEGDFRASAVDGGEVREADPNKSGLRRGDVARRCVEAVDKGEGRVFIPGTMRAAHALYWAWPALVEGVARRKYNYEV